MVGVVLVVGGCSGTSRVFTWFFFGEEGKGVRAIWAKLKNKRNLATSFLKVRDKSGIRKHVFKKCV